MTRTDLPAALDELDLRDKEREEKDRRIAELETEDVHVENFIRRVHCDGDAEIRREDIPSLLNAIADAFEEARDTQANQSKRITELETGNAALQRRLDGRRATCLELAEKMFAEWAKSPPTAGAMTRWFREQLMDWWNPTLETARAAIAKLDDDNAALRKAVAERDEALKFMSMDERRLQRINIGSNTTYRVWGGRWPQAVIGKGPTILAAIQNAMKGCGE